MSDLQAEVAKLARVVDRLAIAVERMTEAQRQKPTQPISAAAKREPEFNPPDDQLIALVEVPRLRWVPRRKGKPRNYTTVWKWATSGLRNKRRLATTLVGEVMYTTPRDVREFLEGPSPATPTHERTPMRARTAHAQADAELAAMGL